MIETLKGLPSKRKHRLTPHKRRSVPRRRVSGRGIVNFCVRGRTPKTTAAQFTPAEMIVALQGGLPVQELDALQAALAVPMESLALLLGISRATLHRRKLAGRLEPSESDRVVRFARLMGMAAVVMESEHGARAWLTSPQFGLGGSVPLSYAQTEIGAREVEDLLGRIEHGVYS